MLSDISHLYVLSYPGTSGLNPNSEHIILPALYYQNFTFLHGFACQIRVKGPRKTPRGVGTGGAKYYLLGKRYFVIPAADAAPGEGGLGGR